MNSNKLTEATSAVASPFDAVHAVIDLARQMNYAQSALAKRMGITRASLYQYIQRKHTPRPAVQRIARQMYITLMDGLDGPLRATPQMGGRKATKLIERYLQMQQA